MDKKYLHHQLTRLRHIRLRYIAAVFVVSLLVSAFALRHNNGQMVELKQAVFAAEHLLDRRQRPSRPPDDRGQARPRIALFEEQRLGGIEDRLPPSLAPAVGTRALAWIARPIRQHIQFSISR